MRMAGSSSITEGDLSISALYAYIWPVISITVAGIAFQAISRKKRLDLFDRFNWILCWVANLTSLYTIIGYPTQWSSQVVDGYLRARGVFYHPNAHSHYMGLLMVYLSGLLMYYYFAPKHRIPPWFLYSTYTLNLLAFILGFSKTAFISFLAGVIILLLMQIRNPVLLKKITMLIVIGLCLLGLAIDGFSIVSGQDFVSMLQERVDDQSSLEFRQQLWQMALSNIGSDNILFGHGLSSINSLLQHQMLAGQRQNSIIDAHNGYLELLYNMGILGASFFLAFLSLIWSCIRYILRMVSPQVDVLCYTIIALCIYYLVALSHEELLSFYPGLILVFGLPTIILTLIQEECHRPSKKSPQVDCHGNL
jgi:O-antigen ligase